MRDSSICRYTICKETCIRISGVFSALCMSPRLDEDDGRLEVVLIQKAVPSSRGVAVVCGSDDDGLVTSFCNSNEITFYLDLVF